MTCTAQLGVLLCTRTDEHTTGHTYVASWAPDLHDPDEPDQ